MEPYILIPWVVLHELESIRDGMPRLTARLMSWASTAIKFIEQHTSQKNSKIKGKILKKCYRLYIDIKPLLIFRKKLCQLMESRKYSVGYCLINRGLFQFSFTRKLSLCAICVYKQNAFFLVQARYNLDQQEGWCLDDVISQCAIQVTKKWHHAVSLLV